MFKLSELQQALADSGVDGWLLYDFRGSNPLARRILQLDADAHVTRRYCYYVPAIGEPLALLHRIEPNVLAHLPGKRLSYGAFREFQAGLAAILAGARRIAMEYAPRGENPYISLVDAGIVELVRELGVEVVSSGALVQSYAATWTDRQWEQHQEATRLNLAAFADAFDFVRREVAASGGVRETTVTEHIKDFYRAHGLVTDHAPIVACGPNAGNPHYSPEAGSDALIRRGDLVLIDSWAKLDQPGAVYSDLTRVAVADATPTAKMREVFRAVADARNAACDLVAKAFAAGRPIEGWEVDDAARSVITAAGYGDDFLHRTGHNIGEEVHGPGANMDNLEMHDTRPIIPRTCFSVEPGIYLPEFGVRSEVNVFVDAAGGVHVTGTPGQEEIEALF